tara:strand:- start:676 stop:1002 length:327 start_codon:yes stop_codon:yes gene_type:complete
MSEQSIIEWVKIDNNIKLLNEQLKSYREKRKHLAKNISENLDNKIIKINNETIKRVEHKYTSPLTLTYIENCLVALIKNDDNVDYIMNYIKENRPYKVEYDIKRFTNK